MMLLPTVLPPDVVVGVALAAVSAVRRESIAPMLSAITGPLGIAILRLVANTLLDLRGGRA